MDNDVLFEVFKLLPLADLLSASLICIQFNNIALDDYIWHGLCEREYPDSYKLYHGDSYYDTYKVCYQLSRLIDKCTEKCKLNELYNLEEIYLYNTQLSKIPKELGKLTNLQELYLNDNPLSEVPKELGQLTNCRIYR